MKRIIISTAYLPPIDYMMTVYGSEEVLVEGYETYSRQTWRNRCRIATSNGPLDLTIPVEKPSGNSTKTAEVLISTRHPWQKNHWRAIQSAYCKSPYFIYYGGLLESIFQKSPPQRLIDWNHQLLQAIASQISPLPAIGFTEFYKKYPEGTADMRDAFSPKKHRQARDSSILMNEYYQVFSSKYKFIPNLSILDLLYNLGPDASSYLEEKSQRAKI